ncbi:MAG: hypothetical protein QXF80_06275 [Thermoplasmatales archaeon]
MAKLTVPREVVIKGKRKAENEYGTFNGQNASAYLGLMQNRRIINFTGSLKLMEYRKCIAKELTGKKPGNFGGVLTQFADAAHKCKAAVAGIPSTKMKLWDRIAAPRTRRSKGK